VTSRQPDATALRDLDHDHSAFKATLINAAGAPAQNAIAASIPLGRREPQKPFLLTGRPDFLAKENLK
jgi:hypothetical protein